jgi:phage repressor protein C with HTH and peptisase S24 domain
MIGLSEAAANGYFDERGFPTAKGWDEIAFPAVNDERVYALEVSGSALEPVYRDGTVLVVSPAATVRRGDRVIVKMRAGEVLAKEMRRRTAKSIELRALGAQPTERTLAVDDVLWIARIMWASQ